jgi:hypothetical protein
VKKVLNVVMAFPLIVVACCILATMAYYAVYYGWHGAAFVVSNVYASPWPEMAVKILAIWSVIAVFYFFVAGILEDYREREEAYRAALYDAGIQREEELDDPF